MVTSFHVKHPKPIGWGIHRGNGKMALNAALLKAIGIEKLIEYFQALDEAGETGAANAGVALRRAYSGMTSEESRAVVAAWTGQSQTLPAEDRACNVLDAAGSA